MDTVEIMVLEAAVVRAMVWLAGHLGVDPVDGVAPRIDAFAFPRGPLVRAK